MIIVILVYNKVQFLSKKSMKNVLVSHTVTLVDVFLLKYDSFSIVYINCKSAMTTQLTIHLLTKKRTTNLYEHSELQPLFAQSNHSCLRSKMQTTLFICPPSAHTTVTSHQLCTQVCSVSAHSSTPSGEQGKRIRRPDGGEAFYDQCVTVHAERSKSWSDTFNVT